MSDTVNRGIPQAPRLVREALHKAWLKERPASYRKADLTLKITFLVWVAAAMSVAGVGASTEDMRMMLGGIIACIVGGALIMWRAQRLYRRGLIGFFYERLDEQGVLTICAGCGYDLRGSASPRRKCPECGKETWRATP